MAPLADTCASVVLVFSAAAGVAEEYLVCFSRQISPDQVNVCSFHTCWIIWIVLNMGAVTVNTLDILPRAVVIHLACVAICADIKVILRTGSNDSPPRVGTQKIAVATAD